jgi:hypothetical protein
MTRHRHTKSHCLWQPLVAPCCCLLSLLSSLGHLSAFAALYSTDLIQPTFSWNLSINWTTNSCPTHCLLQAPDKPQSLDATVLAFMVTQLRFSLAEVMKERDDLAHLLDEATHKQGLFLHLSFSLVPYELIILSAWSYEAANRLIESSTTTHIQTHVAYSTPPFIYQSRSSEPGGSRPILIPIPF